MSNINGLKRYEQFSYNIKKADKDQNGSIVTYVLPDDKNSTARQERNALMMAIAECFNLRKNSYDSIKEILRYLDYLDNDDQCNRNNECGDGTVDVNKAAAFAHDLRTNKKTRDDFVQFLTTVIDSYRTEKSTHKTRQIIKDMQMIIDLLKNIDLHKETLNTSAADRSIRLHYLLNT